MFEEDERGREREKLKPPPPPPLDAMRAYRACLNCRNRKSKCDLDLNQGRPVSLTNPFPLNEPVRSYANRMSLTPLHQATGGSHRGGRRVRKKPILDGVQSSSSTPPSVVAYHNDFAHLSPHYGPPLQRPDNFTSGFENRIDNTLPWNPTPLSSAVSECINSRQSHGTNVPVPNMQFCSRKESIISLAPSKVHEGIASADLENPSDAMEILAQIADRAGDETSADLALAQSTNPQTTLPQDGTLKKENIWHYQPVKDEIISVDTVYSLFASYEESFHPYFPIVPRESFDQTRLPWMSKHEPHLFSAILTIASKNNEQVHQVCYNHIQQLILMIITGTYANVEAVEGLLLLSQWVSRGPQASSAIGRGEEDRVAWMYVGLALRLAYYIGLDRTSFGSENHDDVASFNRKRLVWAACYICDRQVSIRVGRGFWAHGPGPLSGLTSSDFPTLRKASVEHEDYALIFQANLEMTQIFSNVHDILYSSKGHSWKEMLEGRYAKYLDDFRASIRSWHDNWGPLNCSPRIKASLLLTYDYLRLYVNAFAYQATISRALTHQKVPTCTNTGTPIIRLTPLINAASPDLRFIYEALDAAKSLLATFNNLVEPNTLRYMPSTYYLFIIYSAVFLYKARITTTMTDEERQDVRAMVQQTIGRLQKSSTGSNNMGSRYARLLQMLWRKAPQRSHEPDVRTVATNATVTAVETVKFEGETTVGAENYPPNPTLSNSDVNTLIPTDFDHLSSGPIDGVNPSFPPINPAPNGFSWLDLSATWDFATQNNLGGGNSSTGSLVDFGDEAPPSTSGMSPWDFNARLLAGWSHVEGEEDGLIF